MQLRNKTAAYPLHFLKMAVSVPLLVLLVARLSELRQSVQFNAASVSFCRKTDASISPPLFIYDLSPRARWLAAETSRTRGDWANAATAFENLLRSTFRMQIVKFRLGQIYWLRGRKQDAVLLWRQIGANNYYSAICDMSMTRSRGGLSDWKSSVSACQMAVEINPSSAFDWDYLGMALENDSQFWSALLAYQKASQFSDHTNRETEWRLAQMYQRLDQHRSSLSVFLRLASHYPKDPDVQLATGIEFYNTGAMEQAVEHMTNAFELGLHRNTRDCDTFIRSLRALGREADALKYCGQNRVPNP